MEKRRGKKELPQAPGEGVRVREEIRGEGRREGKRREKERRGGR